MLQANVFFLVLTVLLSMASSQEVAVRVTNGFILLLTETQIIQLLFNSSPRPS